MQISMKYEGITDEVTARSHEGWVELQSLQVGTQKATQLRVSEITITKLTDSRSPQFYKAALWGEGKKVTIDFVNNDGTIYLRLELKDTLVSSYSASNSQGGSERPLETLSLNFAQITYTRPAPLNPGQLMESQTLQEMWRQGVARRTRSCSPACAC
jgi:type VI secretion system secreted protein Hcp